MSTIPLNNNLPLQTKGFFSCLGDIISNAPTAFYYSLSEGWNAPTIAMIVMFMILIQVIRLLDIFGIDNGIIKAFRFFVTSIVVFGLFRLVCNNGTLSIQNNLLRVLFLMFLLDTMLSSVGVSFKMLVGLTK